MVNISNYSSDQQIVYFVLWRHGYYLFSKDTIMIFSIHGIELGGGRTVAAWVLMGKYEHCQKFVLYKISCRDSEINGSVL